MAYGLPDNRPLIWLHVPTLIDRLPLDHASDRKNNDWRLESLAKVSAFSFARRFAQISVWLPMNLRKRDSDLSSPHTFQDSAS
jgi:hypothetical protein